MKQKLLNPLIVVVCLLFGGSNLLKAVEITETYDFGAFITANGTGNLTVSGSDIAQSGKSAKVGNVKVINNLTCNSQTLDLKGRFAVDYQYNAGSQIRFMWRSSEYAYQHGLAGQWNSKGTADSQGAARFSILNLKAGDKITITYAKQSGKAADPYTCSASQLTGVDVDAALTSGTKYTVANDGNVDLYFTNNNFAISKIVIETTGNESISDPTFDITGANNGERKVTITAGISDAGNDITTYYTIDGSTPTTTSPSFTTASKEITVGEGAVSESIVTIKALCKSTLGSESSSSYNVTVGTTIKLASPTISFKSMGLSNDKYYKQYVFESVATGTYGNPTIILSAKLGSEIISSPYTASEDGTITVIASADGYEDSDAATLVIDAAPFILGRAYDFTQDSYRDGLTTVGNNITITGAGVQVYKINDVNHIAGITLSNTNFGITKAVNSDTRKGLAPRWGKGNIIINNWIDGSIATLIDEVSNDVYVTSTNGTFSFGSQINTNTFKSLNIYILESTTLPTTISENKFATYSNADYALDFTGLNVKAYKASLTGDNTVQLTPVTKVPAGTGILLAGDAGTYNVPVTATAEALEGNLLKASSDSEIAASIASLHHYVLAKGSSGVGFYNLAANKNIGAGKAYLETTTELAASADARLAWIFADGTTAISDVKGLKENVKGVYDLQGRHVAQPQKGLYLVDGKKIVIK